MVWVLETRADRRGFEAALPDMKTGRWPVALVLAGVLYAHAGLAQAGKALCCVNAQGRNVCGDILPLECYGRAYREMNDRGMTLRQIEAPLTPEQRAQREREIERKKKEEAAAQEEKRRNAALLNTYATERDIDFMRDHTLEPVIAALKETEAKQGEARKRKQHLEGEMEFYKKKAPPASLKDQIKTNENDIKVLSAQMEAKVQEVEQIRARFSEERQRFNQLTQSQGSKRTLPVRPSHE